MRPTVMEINLKNFIENMNNIQKYVGNKKLIPVIKANGYGTFVNKCIDVISKYEIVAVALVQEAVELRKLGFKNKILILNQPFKSDIQDIIENNVTIGLSEISFLEELNNINHKIKVHLEVETGMNRTGIKLENLNEFIDKVKQNKNIIVEGVYTHLSYADFDEEYTYKQLDLFKDAVKIIKSNFDEIKYIHSSASNGLLKFDDGVSNYTRPGIIMYGYEPYNGVKDMLDIKPIATLKTKVTFLKEVEEGESISYSRKYKAKSKIKVATIPIGYADGFRRELFEKGEVVINNQKAPIVGTICMDSCMIDVTDIENVKVGTDVYIWDNKIITLENIANKCNTINYEILCTISNRVPRVFNN